MGTRVQHIVFDDLDHSTDNVASVGALAAMATRLRAISAGPGTSGVFRQWATNVVHERVSISG